MLRMCEIFLTLAVLPAVIQGLPKVSGIKSCYQQTCPEETFACEKSSVVSKDRQNIENEIHCLGLHDSILKTFNTVEKNPYGPSVIFQSYSYKGVYEITQVSDDDTINKNSSGRKHDEKEDAENDIETNHHNYSEVEDLNGNEDPIIY